MVIQNLTENKPKEWNQTGVVIVVGPYNSYYISVDGSRTVTKRNRQFLKKILPFTDTFTTDPKLNNTKVHTTPTTPSQSTLTHTPSGTTPKDKSLSTTTDLDNSITPPHPVDESEQCEVKKIPTPTHHPHVIPVPNTPQEPAKPPPNPPRNLPPTYKNAGL